jgi:hypothetical protein
MTVQYRSEPDSQNWTRRTRSRCIHEDNTNRHGNMHVGIVLFSKKGAFSNSVPHGQGDGEQKVTVGLGACV